MPERRRKERMQIRDGGKLYHKRYRSCTPSREPVHARKRMKPNETQEQQLKLQIELQILKFKVHLLTEQVKVLETELQTSKGNQKGQECRKRYCNIM